MQPTQLKVGELARRTGVSVRTLHHYEEIGLLVPCWRTESGHRLYGERDIARLQQILSLRQIGLQNQLLDRLEAIGSALRETGSVSVHELLETIEVITMFEKYYTPEQLEQLKERRKLVGEERIAEVQQEWSEIFRLSRGEMDKGTDPKDEKVQELARRSAGLIGEFTGGDPGIEKSLRNLYRDQPDLGEKFGYGTEPDLQEYMGRASAALMKDQG